MHAPSVSGTDLTNFQKTGSEKSFFETHKIFIFNKLKIYSNYVILLKKYFVNLRNVYGKS
jgi:hypothetical protein